MPERARLLRKRFLSPGAVLGHGFRTWLRGLPVAVVVVTLSGVLPLLGAARFYDPSVMDSETPVYTATTAYTNTTAATWVIAVLSRFGIIGFAKEAILVGVLSLAACHAGTGVLASLLYSRRAAGAWRGTSLLVLLRLVAFAVLAAFLLVLAKAALVGIGGGRSVVVLLLVVTLLEAWIVSRHWLVVPILAIERVPIGTAIRRSLKLTRGSGFSVFGVVAVLAVLTWVLLFALSRFLTGELGPVYGFGLAGLLMTTIQGAMLAEGYRHLRELREGPDEHVVARVFE